MLDNWSTEVSSSKNWPEGHLVCDPAPMYSSPSFENLGKIETIWIGSHGCSGVQMRDFQDNALKVSPRYFSHAVDYAHYLLLVLNESYE